MMRRATTIAFCLLIPATGRALEAQPSVSPGSTPAAQLPSSAVLPQRPPPPPPAPDLHLYYFELARGAGQERCDTLVLPLRNEGDAPLPDSAYAATASAGGVRIRVEMAQDPHNPSLEPVGTWMLVQLDPGRRIQAAKTSPGSEPFRITLGGDFTVPVLSVARIRITVDKAAGEKDGTDNSVDGKKKCPN